MARPQKKNLTYFSFDVDFFSDKKIKILKSRYGADGIELYIYLLCEIYKNGYYIILDDDWEYIISDDLSMTQDKVRQVLNFLLERSLFNDKLFQSDKVLTSTRIQKNYQEAVKSKAIKTPITVNNFWILKKEETATYIKVTHFHDFSEKNESFSRKNESFSKKNDIKENKNKINKNISKKNIKKKVERFYEDDKLNQAFIDFVDMRKAIKKPMTERAILIAKNKLLKLSTHDGKMDIELAVKILEQSIEHDWQSLYPLMEEKGKKKQSFDQRNYNYEDLERKLLLKKPSRNL